MLYVTPSRQRLRAMHEQLIATERAATRAVYVYRSSNGKVELTDRKTTVTVPNAPQLADLIREAFQAAAYRSRGRGRSVGHAPKAA